MLASSAVKIPSSFPLRKELAPAKASPARSMGFSGTSLKYLARL
jgi:hypothetical protein